MHRKLPQKRLLITGATGMVGASVLARLLRKGRPCAVIARTKGTLSVDQRLDQILRRFEQYWQTDLPRPVSFQGDVNQMSLGLNDRDVKWITGHCDSILHSAASLRFAPACDDENGEPFRTNVGGTQNVVDLAVRCRLKSFHHVSTAYVCGMASGKVYEADIDIGQSFANDYEDSKVRAENLVRRCWIDGRQHSDRTLTVYRPSIVIDRLGLTPVSGDRTIYGAHSMYQMLATRFGLPADREWFRNLGFAGDERKNLIDVHWIAQAMETILDRTELHGQNYHLTADGGTTIEQLDAAFRISTERFLAARKSVRRAKNAPMRNASQTDASEIDKIAAPFVKTFLPYFRDDPVFDRCQIDRVIAETELPSPPTIGTDELIQMIGNWSSPKSKPSKRETYSGLATPADAKACEQVNVDTDDGCPDDGDPDDIVLCGFEVRLPGGVNNARQFEQLLYQGQSAIEVLPPDRLDRQLYLHPQPGTPGKTYTEIGGCVDPSPIDQKIQDEIEAIGSFDLTHCQFAQVAAAAVESAIGREKLRNHTAIDMRRAGVFVGHSGGTELGGALALATMADTATRFLVDPGDNASVALIPPSVKEQIRNDVTRSIRSTRPQRLPNGGPELNAYAAASLTARLLGFQGRREVIDAACSSSLIALHHAATAINNGRLDLAIVGGATYNNVDNLALFSQTGACSAAGSYPFDSRASGLVSSEGYVAVLVARRSQAASAGLRVLATLRGVGISSDGKGKGLWAPRSEGQQLAMRRAIDNAPPLKIDYLECHATSTQVGDATELESLDALLKQNRQGELLIGSVKSNLGHLLEAAGLVGLVKCLIAMRRGEIPPSINFESPTKSFDWGQSTLRVVDSIEPWPNKTLERDQDHFINDGAVAAVNAFGIGGLNAHAVIGQKAIRNGRSAQVKLRNRIVASMDDPIAIVGRGLVLPGAANVSQFAALLASGACHLQQPPADRWPIEPGSRHNAPKRTGLNAVDQPYHVPHAMGGYIHGFRFDAQSYRIPPKVVANANPAQLMLIEAVRQAMEELDGGQWSVDRKRCGVTIGTMFGGQFSNELQIGLRLPEICSHLMRSAISHGVDQQVAALWAESYRKSVLTAYPALLDETGGFTASTLASRIARTFDLMGGACAVDADEASSGLAILTAAEQLSAGQVDTVICGTAQRSIDLVALEQLYRNERLARVPMVEELVRDPSKIFPAEGVAIIVLQRLSDAKKAQRRILGTIRSLGESFVDDVKAARIHAARQSESRDRYPTTKIVGQIGHLGGGHGLVQSIAATIAIDQQQQTSTIVETAADGYQVSFDVVPAATRSTRPIKLTNHPVVTHPVDTNESLLSVHLQAPSAGELAAEIQRAVRDRFDTIPACSEPRQVGVCHAIIVGANRDELHSAANALMDGPLASGHSGTAVKHAALVKLNDLAGDRIAWTFPGQGSQYAAVPRTFQIDSDCQRCIDLFDAELQSLGLDPVGHRLADPNRQLGRDVWWTQAWLLATGTALTASLLRRGLRPDVVLGHSFGECTAAWAAGVMSTRGAIEFAKCRSDAVTMQGGPHGELLSVRSEPSMIHSILRQNENPCVVTHHNSPNQTVIAGPPAAIADAKRHLSSAGIASVVIAVPAAFHTPAMQAARDVLAARQGGAKMRPPRFGFLSATQNCYLAEPDHIKANLIDQLIQPVGFCGAVQRLVADGCGLLIEVGPGNVLSRLASASSNGHAICLSADDPNIDIACCRRLIDLASELFAGPVVRRPESFVAEKPPGETSNDNANTPARATTSRFSVVDVTRRGRRGGSGGEYNRQQDRTMPPTPPAGSHADVEPKDAARDDAARDVAARDNVARQSVATAVAAHGGARQRIPEPTRTLAVTPQSESSADAAKQFLFDLVVDLTGYEPEIIDFDADLEAELGVDSIKKAQLIGELVQWAGLDLTTQDVKLAEYQSMSDILALVSGGLNVAAIQAKSDQTDADQSQWQASSGEAFDAPATDDDCLDVDADALRRLMIDLLVDQTGYDEDIIDMEADLESELGVDSIKRAQLLGELEQQFDLPPIQQSDLKLADFPTLASIHEFIMDQVGTRKKKSPRSLTDDGGVADHCPPSNLASETDQGPTKDSANAEAESLVLPTRRGPRKDVPASGTHRFTLGLRPADRLPGMPTVPSFDGPALVVGDNAIAETLSERLRQAGVRVDELRRPDLSSLDQTLDALWGDDVSQHLFITTPHDREAAWAVDDWDAFSARRNQALKVPYRICQRWMQRVIDDKLMDRSSLVTVLRGGGSFGLDNTSERSNESGAMAGLTKAMLIEAWMRGYRDTPMLIIDAPAGHAAGRVADQDADQVVDGVWRELTVPSYDEEVSVWGASRVALEPIHEPLSTRKISDPIVQTRFPLTRGGNWVVAGGGRGITAMTAMELAERHGLTLQLLGMAPHPQIDEATRDHAIADRADLRRTTMRRIQAQGQNPVKHWRQFEKAIEIDLTLQECRRRGIDAKYHSVNISDAADVQQTLAKIRDLDGPIHGVIQGAGSGQDARFDRKRPDKVEQCFSAKIDGTVALANATRNDPLEWFIGFGSISGRFGANGHTDYSAANDALAKLIGDLGRRRHQTRCVTFHWHAWGDVGMATKPEAKLALDMIGMKFMPASEGLLHFLNEIELGGDAGEVLITDRRYVRKFFPYGEDDRPFAAPLILPSLRGDQIEQQIRSDSYAVTLDPTRDLFLKEHLVSGKPTLPMVIAIEMMAEAASLDRQIGASNQTRVTAVTGLRAIAPLKTSSDDAFAVELVRHPSAPSTWSLTCDLRRRDGRLVEPGRKHFSASVEMSDPMAVRKALPTEHLRDITITQIPVEYLPSDSAVYHGPPLRCLRSIGFGVDPASAAIPIAVGTIVAPSPSHLCGEDRPLTGWVTSPATMDAMLYAAGMLAGQVGGRPSLPVSIDRISLERLPQPGEPLRVIVKWLVATEDQTGGILTAMLVGQNDDVIAELTGYRVGWLGG